LLQFSPNLDFYHGDVPALKSFLLSDKGRIFVADDFKDVWVSVYVIDRPFYQANPAKKILAKKFWRDYFFNRGAYRVDMVDVAT
ncbi:MAG: hypothetical protein ORN57_02615, partial [Alphaproteobacteria bacterium]|nr:hypothetical protein [Alphaproteobacteria bacterium]